MKTKRTRHREEGPTRGELILYMISGACFGALLQYYVDVYGYVGRFLSHYGLYLFFGGMALAYVLIAIASIRLAIKRRREGSQ